MVTRLEASDPDEVRPDDRKRELGWPKITIHRARIGGSTTGKSALKASDQRRRITTLEETGDKSCSEIQGIMRK
jgi:hypothetical protein